MKQILYIFVVASIIFSMSCEKEKSQVGGMIVDAKSITVETYNDSTIVISTTLTEKTDSCCVAYVFDKGTGEHKTKSTVHKDKLSFTDTIKHELSEFVEYNENDKLSIIVVYYFRNHHRVHEL